MKRRHDRTLSVGARQALALPIELEEGAPPGVFRSAMRMLTGVVFALIALSAVIRIPEVSTGVGQVAPFGSIREVAHLEGGIVQTIHAAPGDRVRAGDILIELREQSGGVEHSVYSVRRAALRVRAERLAAQAESRAPTFIDYRENWPDLVNEQENAFAAETARHEQEIRAGRARAEAAVAGAVGAEARLAEAREQLSLSREQLKIQEDLIDEGFTSRQAYLEAKSAFANARAALALSETEKEQAVRARNAASAEMESVIASFRSKASEEHAAVIAELVELERQLVASGDRDARLAIRAPIDGEVKHVAVDGAGDLVRPGAVVAEIVPSDARLLADIRLAPKDIGHVDVGHRAEIAVTTFDPKKYGVLDGSIEHISPDAFVDERTGETYFKARVAIDAASDGPRGLGDLLSAGMEVNVRVTTDTRTLLAYLLKPVVVSLDNAFIER